MPPPLATLDTERTHALRPYCYQTLLSRGLLQENCFLIRVKLILKIIISQILQTHSQSRVRTSLAGTALLTDENIGCDSSL